MLGLQSPTGATAGPGTFQARLITVQWPGIDSRASTAWSVPDG